MCPFSRTSQGAPRQGTARSAYSVKVKKWAELWYPRLRSTTSRQMTTIIAAIRKPAAIAVLYGMAIAAGFLMAAMMGLICLDVVLRHLGYQRSAHLFTLTHDALLAAA